MCSQTAAAACSQHTAEAVSVETLEIGVQKATEKSGCTNFLCQRYHYQRRIDETGIRVMREYRKTSAPVRWVSTEGPRLNLVKSAPIILIS